MLRKAVQVFTVSAIVMATVTHASAEKASPSESVTVTATKSRQVIDKFVKSLVVPTAINGKIARWERRVCPVVVGQNPHFSTFIMQRVKYIALAAGAPVNTETSCTPNIEIVFTTTPQALLDDVYKNDPDYLGYVENSARRQQMATVTRPVQAWYTTETVDMNGSAKIDTGQRRAGGLRLGTMDLPFATSARISGNRIDDGTRSAFNHILIVIDSSKLAGQKIMPLADYISMLALTQLNSLENCQSLPSIMNILATNCDHATDGLTQVDLAYLQGLYKMSAGRKQLFQGNDIADAMADTLAH